MSSQAAALLVEVAYPEIKKRRDKMRDLKICINGSYSMTGQPSRGRIVHGEVVAAGKCKRCLDVHKKTRTRDRAA